jgi:hypothetical protein
MVGRTKQTRSTPELRSRKKVEWHDMPQSALDAFAQFRQQIARPCSRLGRQIVELPGDR